MTTHRHLKEKIKTITGDLRNYWNSDLKERSRSRDTSTAINDATVSTPLNHHDMRTSITPNKHKAKPPPNTNQAQIKTCSMTTHDLKSIQDLFFEHD